VGRLDEFLDPIIRAAGVAGIAIKPDGSIVAVDNVGLAVTAGDVIRQAAFGRLFVRE
jgi:hypothetical protein